MVAEDFEEDFLQQDRDFLNAITGLAFLPVAILMMGLVMYFFGGVTVAFVSVAMLIIILVCFSAIETWSDRYGKDSKKL